MSLLEVCIVYVPLLRFYVRVINVPKIQNTQRTPDTSTHKAARGEGLLATALPPSTNPSSSMIVAAR